VKQSSSTASSKAVWQAVKQSSSTASSKAVWQAVKQCGKQCGRISTHAPTYSTHTHDFNTQ